MSIILKGVLLVFGIVLGFIIMSLIAVAVFSAVISISDYIEQRRNIK